MEPLDNLKELARRWHSSELAYNHLVAKTDGDKHADELLSLLPALEAAFKAHTQITSSFALLLRLERAAAHEEIAIKLDKVADGYASGGHSHRAQMLHALAAETRAISDRSALDAYVQEKVDRARAEAIEEFKNSADRKQFVNSLTQQKVDRVLFELLARVDATSLTGAVKNEIHFLAANRAKVEEKVDRAVLAERERVFKTLSKIAKRDKPVEIHRPGEIPVNAPKCEKCGKMFLECQCGRAGRQP